MMGIVFFLKKSLIMSASLHCRGIDLIKHKFFRPLNFRQKGNSLSGSVCNFVSWLETTYYWSIVAFSRYFINLIFD